MSISPITRYATSCIVLLLSLNCSRSSAADGTLLEQAETLVERGEAERATEIYGEILRNEKSPTSLATAYAARAVALALLGRAADAALDINTAAILDSINLRLRVARNEFDYVVNKDMTACRKLEQLRDDGVKSAVAALRLHQCNGDVAGVAVSAKQHLTTEEMQEADFEAGQLYLKEEKIPEAVQAFSRVIARDSMHFDALWSRAWSLSKLKNFGAADRDYNRLFGLADSDARKSLTFLARSMSLYERNDSAGAYADAISALELLPDEGRNRVWFAQLELRYNARDRGLSCSRMKSLADEQIESASIYWERSCGSESPYGRELRERNYEIGVQVCAQYAAEQASRMAAAGIDGSEWRYRWQGGGRADCIRRNASGAR